MGNYGSLSLLSQVFELEGIEPTLKLKLIEMANNDDTVGLIALGFVPAGISIIAPAAGGARKATIPGHLRKAVFERDGYRCKHCGGWHNLSADHIVPESRGGPTTLGNLQTLCQSCNSRKGTK